MAPNQIPPHAMVIAGSRHALPRGRLRLPRACFSSISFEKQDGALNSGSLIVRGLMTMLVMNGVGL